MDSVESELVAYDADHERRRKSQLERLYNRTPEQVQIDRWMDGQMGCWVLPCMWMPELSTPRCGCGVKCCLCTKELSSQGVPHCD